MGRFFVFAKLWSLGYIYIYTKLVSAMVSFFTHNFAFFCLMKVSFRVVAFWVARLFNRSVFLKRFVSFILFG